MAATITSSWNDITVAPFTPNGTPLPSEADGRHAAGTTYDLVKANSQFVSSSVKPISSGPTKNLLSFGVWVYLETTGIAHYLFTQRPDVPGSEDQWWFCDILTSNTIRLMTHQTIPSAAFIRSISSTTVPLQEWTYISGDLGIEAAGDVNIYINGQEVAYSTQDQIQGANGTGFVDMANLAIGSSLSGTFQTGADARMDRPKFGDDVRWTAQDHADLYAQELADLDGDDPGRLVPSIISNVIGNKLVPNALIS